MPNTPKINTEDIAQLSLGTAPAVLAKRNMVKRSSWCQIPDPEFDERCDPLNPKTITYKNIVQATSIIRNEIEKTPLTKSKACTQLKMEIYYKLEIFHKTGSFCERGALYSLLKLGDKQREIGVITASLGNWAMALAYHGQRLQVPVTIVLPINVTANYVDKCCDYNSKVIVHGNNLTEAKQQAFKILKDNGQIYISGYDHPHVIAAAGSIGIEILEQLPQTGAILIPVGGGALLAGIAAAVKHINPTVLIYGIESNKSCSFFKAMENDSPYQTSVNSGLANALAVPTVGYNAFNTARSLVDKMVLVDDDWLARAILHLYEEEKIVVEGSGAVTLAAFMGLPAILPELSGKTVVCILSGGNIDNYTLSRCLEKAKAIDGRLIRLTATILADSPNIQQKLFSIISNVGCNIVNCYTDRTWIDQDEYGSEYLYLTCETRNLEHACTLKRVLHRIFPGMCEFSEEPFDPISICACFPRQRL